MLTVTKRDGSKEELNVDKIHSMLSVCCVDVKNVSISQIEMNARLQFVDGITTDDIQELLIKSAVDLITPRTPDYQWAAARLLLTSIRKKVYKQFDPLPLLDIIKQNVEGKLYQSDLLSLYTQEEWLEIESFVDYTRDFNFTYAGLKQVYDKYLVRHRVHGTYHETPQVAYILIAAVLFSQYPQETKLQYVQRYYDAISLHKISLATPILAGVRTPTKQYSSCVLIRVDDSLDSIFASNTVLGKYVAQRAGIGLDFSAIRALGSTVRNGEVKHTGAVGFVKMFESTIGSCSQGGLRKGSATLFYPFWHSDVDQYLVLKNNKGNDENRARKLDYGIALSRLFYDRAIKKQDISLFNPHDVQDLLAAFGLPEFDALYLQYEQSDIVRTTVNAYDLLLQIVAERSETGRIYIFNIDHANSHSSFIRKIWQSNLCVAPETKILTSTGYKIISDLENQEVDIWNGEEWSTTTIVKTSEKSELVKVVIDKYETIECTPYHKFYTISRYLRHNEKPEDIMKEVRACDLKSGDKLIKFDLPVIQGNLTLDLAYVRGVYTGDGSQHRGVAHIDLYGKKKLLLEYLPYTKVNVQDNQDRMRVFLEGIKPEDKFVVPTADYTIESRIQWLAGLVDTDGHIVKNGSNCGLQIGSINLEFLKDLKLVLQTLGVNSKILFATEAAMRLLPNGHGGKSYYNCKNSYRLQVSSSGFQTLLSLGLQKYVHNHSFEAGIPNREATRYSTITSVECTGRQDATYCFTESIRHMGMFNGFLTGQCLEITEPTETFQSLDDPNGEIATCILSAYNLGNPDIEEDMPELADLIVRGLDAIIDIQEYPFVMAAKSSLLRRNIGIGYINFAYWLAKNELKWDSDYTRERVHQLAESTQYWLLRASNNLAKERGACGLFAETKYAHGLLPIDTYKKDIDSFAGFPLQHDWENLRHMIAMDGLRNSTLTCIMPSESSAVVANATNGIEPPRQALTNKGSKSSVVKILVPEYDKLEYQYLWSIPNNEGYLKVVAIMQKFFDQSISTNLNYNPLFYANQQIPLEVVLRDILNAYKWGIKTLYYHNTYDMNSDQTESGCDSGACAI